MTYRTLGFPEYGITNASNFKYSFTHDSNPKKGLIQKWPTKLTLLCVKAPSLKNSVRSYLGVLRVRNNICKHFKCGFTPFVVVIRV